MPMDIWNVEHYHYNTYDSPRGDYEIKTTNHHHMRDPLANTPGYSAPTMIHECTNVQENDIL